MQIDTLDERIRYLAAGSECFTCAAREPQTYAAVGVGNLLYM